MEKEIAKISPQQILMTAIPFSYEDLEANRDGYMTARQRSRLNDDRFLIQIVGVLALMVCPVCIIAAFVLDGQRYNTVVSRVIVSSAIGLLTVGTTAYAGWRWQCLGRDLRQGKVAAVQGLISLEMGGDRNRTYRVKAADVTLKVPQHVFFAFKNGEPYCLYYAPHSRTLLSAEWLREE
ncbi:MAG TPA: hypothetical protein VHO69_15885 [Phototrophicaceae bacterium]|nr:hypothetical protein [Phototrophicaceae bacterium]